MEKKREFIINILYIAIICALIYFGINYLFGLLVPFVLGFLFAYFAIRISRNVLKNDSKLHRILTLVFLYLLIVLLIILLISLGVNKIGDFIKTLPSFYKNTIDPYISSLELSLDKFGESLPEGIRGFLGDIVEGLLNALKTALSSAASGLVNITTGLVKGAPEAMISIIVTIITSVYFAVDYEEIAGYFTNLMSEKMLDLFYEIKDFIENTLFKILGSYGLIMCITFVELFIGLTIFRISNSGMWAFVIALLDILPVLGVGTVLIPWGISALITGNYVLGIEILVLYIVIAVIRNIIEPKFVGTDLGLHPLATLFTMIVGLRLFGAVGMFGLPLALSFYLSKRNKLAAAVKAK